MDLNVIQPRATLLVTSFRVVEVGEYPVVEVKGVSGYRKVIAVEINGVKSSRVSILGDAKLHATIPQGVDEISTVDVYTSSTEAGTYNVAFRLGSRPISGVDRVAQKVVKVLLTRNGSDIFNPDLGVGLTDLIGRSFTGFGELSADVALSIRSAENQIKEAEKDSPLPESEKLGSIHILSISPLFKDGVSIDIEVTNKLGEASRIGVPL